MTRRLNLHDFEPYKDEPEEAKARVATDYEAVLHGLPDTNSEEQKFTNRVIAILSCDPFIDLTLLSKQMEFTGYIVDELTVLRHTMQN